jgi:hypothetical protein
MKAKLNYFSFLLYSDFNRLIINDKLGVELMQRFSKGLLLILMLFVLIPVNTKAVTSYLPGSSSVSKNINSANSGEVINIASNNDASDHQASIMVLSVPVITWPANGADIFSVTPTLSWYLSTSSSDTVTYSVIVRNSADPVYSGTGYFSLQGIDTTSIIIPDSLALTPGTTYFFEVIAIFSGVDSIESAEQSFTVDSSLGRAPVAVPSWPVGNATVFSPTPTLNWYLSTWTEGALSYNIFITDTLDNSIVSGGPITSSSTSLTLGTALKGGHTYNWRVETINGALLSGYSSAATFTVDASQGGAPVAVPGWPIDSETVYSASPTLAWYLSSYASGAIRYVVTVTDSSNTLVVTDTTSNSYLNLSAVLSPGGIYNWSVETINGTASSGFSLQATFIVDKSQGGAPQPVLSWPVGDATVYTTVPSFSWYLSYGTIGTLNYNINISDSTTHSIVPGSPFSSSTTTFNLDSTHALIPGDTYDWNVNVINGLQQSGYAGAGTFTVFNGNANVGLPTPVASWPTGGNLVYTDSAVEFSWYLNSPPPSGNYSYTIEIKSQALPFDGITPANDSSDNIVVGGITASTYTLTTPTLSAGTAYHWRVRLISGSDSSAWSDVNVNGGALFSTLTSSDTVESLAMAVIGTPDHVVLSSASPSFSWYVTTKPAAGQTYTIELSPNSNLSNAVVYPDLNSYSKAISGLSAGSYYWRVKATSANGKYSSYSKIAVFSVKNITAVSNKNGSLPKNFAVSQNFPNPFNPSTLIDYSLPVSSLVSIKIYNVLGQEVKTLVNSRLQAGNYTAQWNGENNSGRTVASGVYIYRVEAGQYVKTMKMMLLK